MSGSPRQMPTVDQVVAYWSGVNAPWLKSYNIGWLEPFCFACGWMPPCAATPKLRWRIAGRWLDRAHLQDHASAQNDQPCNIVMMCHLCHERMPSFENADSALEWVKRQIKTGSAADGWQMYTDSVIDPNQPPTRPTTLIRLRKDFESRRAYALQVSADAPHWIIVLDLALTPAGGHLTRENVHYGKIASGVHS